MVPRVFPLLLLCLPTVALADEYPTANTLIWASVGQPWLVSARAEGWLGDQVTGEVGVGALGLDATVGFDWAFRWRPDVLCLACGRRDFVSIGFGPGGLVTPPVNWPDWRLAAGGDVGVAYVHWLSPKTGVTLAGHAGAGAGWNDLEIEDSEFTWWGFAGAGLAF